VEPTEQLQDAVAAAAALHLVHQRVGGGEQVARLCPPAGADAADADQDLDRRRRRGRVRDAVPPGAKRAHQAFGDQVGVGDRGQPLQHHDELVPADPRHGVPRADDRPQPPSHFHEHAVTHRVAQRVVDLLEAVAVEEQHGDERRVAAGRGQRLVEPVHEHRAGGQSGQRVVGRAVTRGAVVDDEFDRPGLQDFGVSGRGPDEITGSRDFTCRGGRDRAGAGALRGAGSSERVSPRDDVGHAFTVPRCHSTPSSCVRRSSHPARAGGQAQSAHRRGPRRRPRRGGAAAVA
jgi:hypothetical protein